MNKYKPNEAKVLSNGESMWNSLGSTAYVTDQNQTVTQGFLYAPPTFTSRDPLFEKYFWLSPYTYCANNPMKYVDPTGCEVETDEEGLNVLKNTVSKKDAKYIKLDKNGFVDKSRLNKCKNNEGNIGKLKEIVNNSRIVNFKITDQFEYMGEDGISIKDMGKINVNMEDNGIYTPSTDNALLMQSIVESMREVQSYFKK